MFPETRLKEELSYASVDIDRALRILDILKMMVPGGPTNPHWTMALQDLNNARTRISHINTALVTPEAPPPTDLPAAAPAPQPLV